MQLLDKTDFMEFDLTQSTGDTHRVPGFLALRHLAEPTNHAHKPSSIPSTQLDGLLKRVRGTAQITNDHPVKRYLTPGDDPIYIAKLNFDKLNVPYGSDDSVEGRDFIAQRNFDMIRNRTTDEQDGWSLDAQHESNRSVHTEQQQP